MPEYELAHQHASRAGSRATGSGALGSWFLTSARAARPGDARRRRPALSATTAFADLASSVPARPKTVPLAVRSPYLNTWLPGDSLAGTWPRFWNGRVTAICGIARIDGVPHLFAGSPGDLVPAAMRQIACEVTASRSVFVFEAAGMRLTVTFFSPVDPNDLRRQCVPFSYVAVQAASSDGADHDVSVHLDISAEWAHGDSGRSVTWQRHRTGGGNLALTFTPDDQAVFGETGDQASWGTVVFATAETDGVTWELGPDTVVRARSAFQGRLADTVDVAQHRAISDDWPVAALNRDFGTVTASAPPAAFVTAIGHLRTQALSYQGTDLMAWWTRQWDGWGDAADWFLADYPAAMTAAATLDATVTAAAKAAVGDCGAPRENYATLCALAVRQAMGCTEIVDRNGAPWVFLKDIASGGRVSPVDNLFSAAPAFLYLSPDYLRLLLEPYFEVCERDELSVPSDLGARYPHVTGGRDDLAPGRTSKLLVMTAALVGQLSTSAASFASGHYRLLRSWAEYLVANAHRDGASVSDVDGIRAMSVIASVAGEYLDQAHYSQMARGLKGTRTDADLSAPEEESAIQGPGPRRARLTDWYVVPTAAHQGVDRFPIGGDVFAPLLSPILGSCLQVGVPRC
jgi:hypothetical protein